MERINVSKKKERKHLFKTFKTFILNFERGRWSYVPNFPIGPTPIFSLGTCFSFSSFVQSFLTWWVFNETTTYLVESGVQKSSTINNSYIKLPSLKVEKCSIYLGRKHFSIFKNCRAELFLRVQM